LVHLSAEYISLAISLIALFAAGLQTRHAKRSARAAEAQALAAHEQVEAAKQALATNLQEQRSTEAVELSALADAHAKIDAASPRLILGIEKLDWPPIVFPYVRRDDAYLPTPIDYPKSVTGEEAKEFDYFMNRWDELYFWVRGVIINDAERSTLIAPRGMELIEGKSALLPGHFKVPPCMDPRWRKYLLRSGEAALFEWRAGYMLQQWVNLYHEARNANPPSATLLAHLSGEEENISTLRLELQAQMVYPISDDEDTWKLPENGNPEIIVHSPSRIYPRSLKWLAKDVRGTQPIAKWLRDDWDLANNMDE
jgi:hypothetical protein